MMTEAIEQKERSSDTVQQPASGTNRGYSPRKASKALTMVQSPGGGRRFLTTILVMLGLLIALLILIPWRQTVAGSGSVTSFSPNARPQAIESPISARISKWFVYEGSRVKSGDTIALLLDINVSFMDREFLDKLQEIRDNTILSQQYSIEMAQQRTAQAIQRAEAAEASVSNTELELKTAKTRYERAKDLSAEGLASTRELESAQLALQKAETDLVRMKASLRSALQDLEAIRSDEQRISQLSRVTINDAELRLANARQRKSASVVTAPLDGTVVRIAKAGAGQVIKEGEVLAMIVPANNDQAVEIFVSSMDAAIIDTGAQVRLQFSGFPAIQFSGFPGISVGTFGGRVAVIDAVDDGSGKYRVLVIPDQGSERWPGNRFLRQGAEVTGWVLLNEVSLGYELWRQINGFPPVITVREHKQGTEGKGMEKEKQK